MSHFVKVPLPLNISPDETGLYGPYQSYPFPVQKIKLFKNVFITHSGFCINKDGLIKECHHDYKRHYNSYLAEASLYYRGAVKDPDNLITLDDDTTYLLIHHPWYNYYHWMCESIFRLWMARRRLDRVTLILPRFYWDADFITGSLAPFGLKNIFFIPSTRCLYVKNLCLPQIKPLCDSYNGLHVRQVRQLYRDYIFKHSKPGADKLERLYISRKLAGRRRVINEEEIETILCRFGFTIFYPENHPFLGQVAIFAQVRWLVGEHGSGLTNLLFMVKGSSVLELHKDRTNELDHPSFLFWYMAEALGIKYYHQSCATYGKEDYYEGDYIVEAALFEKNIRRLLAQST
jgi:capsular polysaccharide biosynthesis protein